MDGLVSSAFLYFWSWGIWSLQTTNATMVTSSELWPKSEGCCGRCAMFWGMDLELELNPANPCFCK